MTLQVPFEEFAKTAERMLGHKVAFVRAHGKGSLITAAAPDKNISIASCSDSLPEDVKGELSKAGFELMTGEWAISIPEPVAEDPLDTAYVASVSYISGEHKPGVWVDAYPTQPTHVQVLRALFEEFNDTGELADVSFEEFVRLANPNVVVVAANELRSYLREKEDV